MAGLQRSVTSFRRQGSSGLVWDDKVLSGELNRLNQKEEENKAIGSINTMERSRSNGGGRAFRTSEVSPAIEPPSPRVSACGFCGGFGNKEKSRRQPKTGNRRT